MNFLHKLSNGIGSASPQDDVPVRVASDDIAERCERQARHIFGLFSAVEDSHLLVQRAVLIKRPKRDMVLADGDDLIAVERMKFGSDDSVDRAFCLRDFLAGLAFLPFPHANGFLRRVVNRQQQRSVVSLTKADTGDRRLEVANTNNGHRRQRNGIPHANVRRSQSLVLPGALACRNQQLVGVNRKAFDVIGVTQIVTLRLLVDVIKHNRCRDEINNFAGWQLVEIGAAVLSAVSVSLK